MLNPQRFFFIFYVEFRISFSKALSHTIVTVKNEQPSLMQIGSSQQDRVQVKKQMWPPKGLKRRKSPSIWQNRSEEEQWFWKVNQQTSVRQQQTLYQAKIKKQSLHHLRIPVEVQKSVHQLGPMELNASIKQQVPVLRHMSVLQQNIVLRQESVQDQQDALFEKPRLQLKAVHHHGRDGQHINSSKQIIASHPNSDVLGMSVKQKDVVQGKGLKFVMRPAWHHIQGERKKFSVWLLPQLPWQKKHTASIQRSEQEHELKGKQELAYTQRLGQQRRPLVWHINDLDTWNSQWREVRGQAEFPIEIMQQLRRVKRDDDLNQASPQNNSSFLRGLIPVCSSKNSTHQCCMNIIFKLQPCVYVRVIPNKVRIAVGMKINDIQLFERSMDFGSFCLPLTPPLIFLCINIYWLDFEWNRSFFCPKFNICVNLTISKMLQIDFKCLRYDCKNFSRNEDHKPDTSELFAIKLRK
ncbi:unnamed protein product [Nezara viridula]|uniref:DUF4773 domain-containing protein n=1 Tax=Nezara viridula TaxID=85310 RepID=A0A9P0MJT8_NEZVI|nr:unnamed protein product [Nezara viridula]